MWGVLAWHWGGDFGRWDLKFKQNLCCAQGELGHESLGTKSVGFFVSASAFYFLARDAT